jgi:predicted tellurium resistance membrane protein TerC
MMELLADPQTWIAFLTLTALEIVLGIDNIIFISILVDRLPPERREFTRRIGLALAMVMRLALLFTLAWMVGATATLFTVLGEEISTRDLILIVGGLFLIWKATGEIHGLVQGEEHGTERKMAATFAGILAQIALIDLVFSLDSIITAVGMVDDIRVMVAAVVVSVGLMMVAAGPIGRFVSRHPTIKTLALSFLIMVGMALVADGLDFHVPKGYIYFAMAFSVAVEMLNLRMRRNAELLKPKKQK